MLPLVVIIKICSFFLDCERTDPYSDFLSLVCFLLLDKKMRQFADSVQMMHFVACVFLFIIIFFFGVCTGVSGEMIPSVWPDH